MRNTAPCPSGTQEWKQDQNGDEVKVCRILAKNWVVGWVSCVMVLEKGMSALGPTSAALITREMLLRAVLALSTHGGIKGV